MVDTEHFPLKCSTSPGTYSFDPLALAVGISTDTRSPSWDMLEL